MRVDIQGRGFGLTAPLLEHTQRLLRSPSVTWAPCWRLQEP